MVRRLLAPSLALGLVAAWLVLLAPPAHAACHIAGFVESDVEASESTGVVSLVVELQGRVGSCAGTVDVMTVDGTAVAGEDYEAVSRTLTFEENDDRVETVDVTILADEESDGGETFTLELANPTGGISGTGGPATVTITEDGAGTGDDTSDGDEPSPDEDEPAPPTDDPGEEPTEEEGDDAGEGDDDAAGIGGGTIGIVVGVVVAIAILVGAFVLLRGRGE